jgi:hypothetical protein
MPTYRHPIGFNIAMPLAMFTDMCGSVNLLKPLDMCKVAPTTFVFILLMNLFGLSILRPLGGRTSIAMVFGFMFAHLYPCARLNNGTTGARTLMCVNGVETWGILGCLCETELVFGGMAANGVVTPELNTLAVSLKTEVVLLGAKRLSRGRYYL